MTKLPMTDGKMTDEELRDILNELSNIHHFGQGKNLNEMETFITWVKIGKLLNIFEIFPYHKLVINSESKDTHLLSYVLNTSKEVLDHITSDDIFTDTLVTKCVEEILDKRGKYQ